MSKTYRYALASKDKKVAGVFAHMGKRFGVDPTFLRIGFVASFLFISWEVLLIAYVAAGIFFSLQRKKEMSMSEYDRLQRPVRGSVHDARTKLDEKDRRMMAIDHHLHNADSDALAREIEALKEEK
ncbi:PspC domain-containing protein [Sphingomicrobium lutaoense]|uniref:Phage shock protein PspC (Stress-responsive transcriptional regulator) n=1 Tax=Sphingomicrobium lutaoense TaxID=515949 RepID=A0A839Z3L2_9SPHN|nr:PspC domain-containing protein [Sphingomicrobium lutaoense]MBB3763174.1 phage shock protein PspC (stress-responsive transcriptional regulator) [Sphingomicrobium lutaoense]